ncbi:MAG: STAS/SEC14 domain-containing protein [Flavobacteriales bacterium]|nr:STAS/SEC14 domain-containing protein [Flavobacteriales bacterium]
MTTAPTTVDTALAVIHASRSDLFEFRFKPDAVLSSAGIQEIIQARTRLPEPERPPLVLLVLHEGLRLEMELFNRDQYAGHAVHELHRAVAIVVLTPVQETLTRLYFTYNPSPVPTEMFRTEAEALAWLAGQ